MKQLYDLLKLYQHGLISPKIKNVHELKAEYIFEQSVHKKRIWSALIYFGVVLAQLSYIISLALSDRFRDLSIFGIPEGVRFSDEILFYLVLFNVSILPIAMTVVMVKYGKRDYQCVYVKELLAAIMCVVIFYFCYRFGFFIDPTYSDGALILTAASATGIALALLIIFSSIVYFIKKRPIYSSFKSFHFNINDHKKDRK